MVSVLTIEFYLLITRLDMDFLMRTGRDLLDDDVADQNTLQFMKNAKALLLVFSKDAVLVAAQYTHACKRTVVTSVDMQMALKYTARVFFVSNNLEEKFKHALEHDMDESDESDSGSQFDSDEESESEQSQAEIDYNDDNSDDSDEDVDDVASSVSRDNVSQQHTDNLLRKVLKHASQPQSESSESNSINLELKQRVDLACATWDTWIPGDEVQAMVKRSIDAITVD